MIILGSQWDSAPIDLQLDSGTEFPITGHTLTAYFFEGRIGSGSRSTDDYGTSSASNGPTPLLTVSTADGGVAIIDGPTGIFNLTLTEDQTEELRRKLGAPYWKGRILTIQVKRTDNDRDDHIIFITERTLPGARAGA